MSDINNCHSLLIYVTQMQKKFPTESENTDAFSYSVTFQKKKQKNKKTNKSLGTVILPKQCPHKHLEICHSFVIFVRFLTSDFKECTSILPTQPGEYLHTGISEISMKATGKSKSYAILRILFKVNIIFRTYGFDFPTDSSLFHFRCFNQVNRIQSV